MGKGLLIVISGPSGVGKGTVLKALMREMPSLVMSISETTRAPRTDELHGVNYFFVSEEEFLKNIGEQKYFEWAKVYKNYYGTPKDFIMQEMDKGNHVILEIDTDGAMQVKKAYPEGVFIYIAPPSLEELKNRILKRNTDSEEQIRHRLTMAESELKLIKEYDYIVENNEVEETVKEIAAIITAEQCRVNRKAESDYLEKYSLH